MNAEHIMVLIVTIPNKFVLFVINQIYTIPAPGFEAQSYIYAWTDFRTHIRY